MTRMLRSGIGLGAGALALGMAMAAASPAAAQANVMKDCAAKYQAAKTAKTLPAGQTWLQYLAQCRAATKTVATTKTTVAAPAPAPAATTATKTVAARTVATSTVAKTNVPVTKAPGQRTPAQLAEESRQKQCGTQWKADKAAGKTGTMTWPQYWSACSKRLKG